MISSVISSNSYSNNRSNLFYCQLNHKQTNNFPEFIRDNLTKSQFRVLDVIMQLTLKYSRQISPSLELIAKMAKCAKSTVQEAIRTLKELNIIRTEHRGFKKTLIFKMHEMYFNRRREIASLVSSVVTLSLLFLLSPKAKSENRYLIKEKVDYLSQRTFSKDGTIMFQLSQEQFSEIKGYPSWIYERSLILYQKKIKEGASICNQPAYFMGIFRQEAAKAGPKALEMHPPLGWQDQGKKDFKPKTGKPKEFVRPQDGPYAIYKHKPVIEESDFERALNMRRSYDKSPNIFLKPLVDAALSRLTDIEIRQIDDIIASTRV